MPTLIINKSDSSVINPTLVEKTTLDPVYYLLEIQNDLKTAKVYCILTEQSTELQRYNEFTIVEKTNPNPLLSEVNLSIGQYEYVIYEQSSNSNLMPTGLHEVERGILKCEDPNAVPYTEYADTPLINTVYEG